MSVRRWFGMGAMLGAVVLLAPPRPVAAGLDGPCDASGTFVTGTKAAGSFTVNAKDVGSKTVVIPRKDTVNWTGSVNVPATTRAYAGSVTVKLPPPFGDVTIDSWNGSSARVSNSGTHEYNLPKMVPAGVTFTVQGQHVEPAATCSGSVAVQIEGGLFDSPIAPISFALTGLVGAGFVAAIWPMFRPISRRIG